MSMFRCCGGVNVARLGMATALGAYVVSFARLLSEFSNCICFAEPAHRLYICTEVNVRAATLNKPHAKRKLWMTQTSAQNVQPRASAV